MKREFTKLMTAFALLLFIVPPMVGWGQTSNEVTYTFSQHYNANTTLTDVAIAFDDNITATFHKGSGSTAPQYYTNGTAVRWYGGNTLDITATNATISAIEFTYTQKNKDVTANVGEYNHDEGTWTGSESSVTFTVASGSGHNRVSEIKVTYTTSGGTPAPSITANNVEIAYDATEGAIEYTINNPAVGGVLIAGTEAEWLEIGEVGETVPFTCTVNDNGERVATVTLTYTYDTDQTVTKNVTVTQATNPNGPGSEANPYTVAQARAAIDAGTGTQGVYATGIVSAIPTAYNSTYGNVTFNMVDEEGDEEFLQAYRCGGDEAANVAVGDVVVVYGNLTKYGSTYEFGQGCQIVTLTHPVITDPTITVDPAVVNVDADEHDGTLALTYANLTINEMSDFDVQYYNAEGQEAETPDWIEVLVAEQDPTIGEGYVVSYIMMENEGEARSAYFKVYAMDDEPNLVYSNLVTINQAAYVAPALDYATLPFEFNGGRADIEGTDGLTQEGLGSDYNATSNPTTKLKFDGTGDWMLLHFNEAPGTLLFDIKGNGFNGGTFTVQTSEDGETYEDLVAYSELGDVDTKTFNNLGEDVRYIKWIYTEKSSGNVGLGNIYLYEFGGGPAPEPSITFSPNVFDLDAGQHVLQIPFTYENIEVTNYESFTTHFYNAEGEEIQLTQGEAWYYCSVTGVINGEGYQLTGAVIANEGEARSGYMKVSALDAAGETVYSNLVTINQAAYVAPVLDYATLPFEFNGGKADIENTDGLTQEGLGSDYGSAPKLRFDGTGDWLLLHFEGDPGELAFDIKGNSFSDGTFTVQTSEDGETYTDFATFTELAATEHMTYNTLGENVRYIKWIYTEKVNGNVALGNITLGEYTGPVASIMVEFDEIEVTATGEDDYAAITYENLEITQASDFDIQFYDAAGAPLAEQPDWIAAEVTTQIGEEGYFVYYVIDDNEGEARTAYFKVYALDANAELVYSNLVTVSQEAYEVPVDEQQFALYGGNLVEGDYIIYYNGKAMNNVVSSGRLQYAEIEPEDNVITTDNAAIVWHIAQNADGYWTIYSADANAYAASTGVKNKAQMLEDGTDDMAMWTVSEISGTYEFVNKANAAGDINANLRNNGTYGFACYATTTGGALSLYKYTETVVTYTKEIAGYGTSDGGYYLIASPVLGVTPTIENGFLTNEYDLYYFDQAQESEVWRNFEAKPFNIASGKGYLYASQNGTTLTFTGIPYEGYGEVALDYDEDAPFGGWNLIGNPYSGAASLLTFNGETYVSRDFYVMNEAGTEIELANRSVNPMEGIFVQANAADEMVYFNDGSWTGGLPNPGAPIEEDKLNLRVSNGNGSSDFARVRFDEGQNLEKFQLNPNSTKIYFPQGENDYAVVRSANEGEMPVNFKAAENGTYTLSVDLENMEANYLHLIDNMTGTDIDLLQTPDYSFEATVNDNAARFTLVFAGLTGIEETHANTFAFFNGNEWVINNMGEATLQMVDMTGRIVSSTNINGDATLSIDNLSAGVYVMRLVNGENVKNQKVIVK